MRVMAPFTRSWVATKSSASWLSTSTSALPMPTTSRAVPSSRTSRRICSDAGGVTLGDGTRGRYRCPVPSDDATASTAASGDQAGRLPTSIRPERYDLRLAPDLATSTFRGAASVNLDVVSPAAELVCNAAELDVSEAWVDLDGRRIDGEIHLDADLEQLRVALPETLPSGTATLHLTFSGVLNDRLRGFYRSTYTADDGGDRAIAVTQFEPTDARRAFPCWDEPEFKAVFGVTLDVAEDLLAISNGPELAREDLGEGRVRIRFADTMPMSTYLVAFVVGP
ncbi:MAG TPA: hypothetical protein DCS55_05435, partial [Acidimicrobiaceae bacterium]|nr:hypothetical protein [Acidimicrobiaceae bacterium]